MKTSSYLDEAIFHDQVSAIDEYYEKKADHLFEHSKDDSYVEFHVQRPSHKDHDGPCAFQDEPMIAPEGDSYVDSDAFTKLSSTIKQTQNADGPPQYTGAPVERWRISSTQELRNYAAVGPLEHVLSRA